MTESIDISSALWLLMIRTFHMMRRARQRELNQYGITTRNSAVLSTIIRLGKETTLIKIAQQLVLEDHSMSEQLSRMEKAGLIKKVKGQKRNSILIEVTRKGYELYDKGMQGKSVGNIMSVLTKEEQQSLWTLIAKIREQSIKELGKANDNLYPPSDPAELDPTTNVW